jgi:hypothetical protein
MSRRVLQAFIMLSCLAIPAPATSASSLGDDVKHNGKGWDKKLALIFFFKLHNYLYHVLFLKRKNGVLLSKTKWCTMLKHIFIKIDWSIVAFPYIYLHTYIASNLLFCHVHIILINNNNLIIILI